MSPTARPASSSAAATRGARRAAHRAGRATAQLRERMGAAARERAHERFDIARQLDELERSTARSRRLGPSRRRAPTAGSARRLRAPSSSASWPRSATASLRSTGFCARGGPSRPSNREVDQLVPADARVLVVSGGDDELLGSADAWRGTSRGPRGQRSSAAGGWRRGDRHARSVARGRRRTS